MDWKLFAQLLVTFFVAALGWWIGHHFSARRDLANERRKLRISYLLEAYRRLEGASNRKDYRSYWASTLVGDSRHQLLGSVQVSLAQEFSAVMADHSTGSLDELILDLRQSLRTELELEPVAEKIIYLRFVDRT